MKLPGALVKVTPFSVTFWVPAMAPYIDESSSGPACATPTNAMAAADATGASRLKRITMTSRRMLGILVISRTTESRDPAGILRGRSLPGIPEAGGSKSRPSIESARRPAPAAMVEG